MCWLRSKKTPKLIRSASGDTLKQLKSFISKNKRSSLFIDFSKQWTDSFRGWSLVCRFQGKDCWWLFQFENLSLTVAQLVELCALQPGTYQKLADWFEVFWSKVVTLFCFHWRGLRMKFSPTSFLVPLSMRLKREHWRRLELLLFSTSALPGRTSSNMVFAACRFQLKTVDQLISASGLTTPFFS